MDRLFEEQLREMAETAKELVLEGKLDDAAFVINHVATERMAINEQEKRLYSLEERTVDNTQQAA